MDERKNPKQNGTKNNAKNNEGFWKTFLYWARIVFDVLLLTCCILLIPTAFIFSLLCFFSVISIPGIGPIVGGIVLLAIALGTTVGLIVTVFDLLIEIYKNKSFNNEIQKLSQENKQLKKENENLKSQLEQKENEVRKLIRNNEQLTKKTRITDISNISPVKNVEGEGKKSTVKIELF